MIAYPAYHGLPPWEPAVLLLENKHDLEGKETDVAEVNSQVERNQMITFSVVIFFFTLNSTFMFLLTIIICDQYLNADETTLWWAGKELLRGKLLSDYVGKNEKTKIVAKLAKSGAGMPVREPQVDEETYKKMLSYYHKKQEEHKVIEQKPL